MVIIDTIINHVLAAPLPEDISTPIIERLKSLYSTPPVSDVSAVLKCDLSSEDVRVLLFDPSNFEKLSGMSTFVSLLRNPISNFSSWDGESSASVVQTSALSLVYIYHLSDFSFVRRFILHDGLIALSELLRHPDLYIRSQAIDCFLQITSHPDYDWFSEPKLGSMLLDKSMNTLSSRMLQLGYVTSFVADLLDNWNYAFPGGSYSCLQLLAFWLSWTRKQSPTERLFFHPLLIERFKQWSERPVAEENGDEELSIEPGGSKNTSSCLEEKELASCLYDDFKNYSMSEMKDSNDSPVNLRLFSDEFDFFGSINSFDPPIEGIHENDPSPPTGNSSNLKGESLLQLKHVGNSLFRKEQWHEAFDYYSLGISKLITTCLQEVDDDHLLSNQRKTDIELLTQFLSNRTSCRLRDVGYGPENFPNEVALMLGFSERSTDPSALKIELAKQTVPVFDDIAALLDRISNPIVVPLPSLPVPEYLYERCLNASNSERISSQSSARDVAEFVVQTLYDSLLAVYLIPSSCKLMIKLTQAFLFIGLPQFALRTARRATRISGSDMSLNRCAESLVAFSSANGVYDISPILRRLSSETKNHSSFHRSSHSASPNLSNSSLTVVPTDSSQSLFERRVSQQLFERLGFSPNSPLDGSVNSSEKEDSPSHDSSVTSSREESTLVPHTNVSVDTLLTGIRVNLNSSAKKSAKQSSFRY